MQNPPDSERLRQPTILLVSEPGVDGVFHYVRNLADYLLSSGWRVHFAYSSLRGCLALFDLVARVKANGGETLDLRVGNGPRPADAGALVRLWRLARATAPEIVHAHSSKAGALARVLPLLGIQARFFYTPHAYFQMNQPMNTQKLVFSAVERVLGQVGTTICVSRTEKRYAREIVRIPERKLRLVSSGVHCERFRPAHDSGEKRAARAQFGLPPDALLFGTVARYTAQKDPVTLYRAVIDALTTHPTLCFAHLGTGALEGEINSLLEPLPRAVRARIFQIESSPEHGVFYRALDAFVLPSLYEGLALSSLEAVATGLTLILSRCAGNNDLEEYGLNDIYWTVPGDRSSLVQQIGAWLVAPSVGNNHRQSALAHLGVERALQEILSCYQT